MAQALAQIAALSGWTHDASARMPRATHRAACALLRPAEKLARRMIVALAAKLPAPRLAPARPAAPAPDPKGPRVERIALYRPLGFILDPKPPKAPRRADPTIRGFRLFEPAGFSLPAPNRRARRIAARNLAPSITSLAPDAPARAPRPAQDAPDPDSRPAIHIAARAAALRSALENPARYARRMARWLARRRAGRTKRRSPLSWRAPGRMVAAPRRGGLPYETLDHTLHHIALMALDSS